jgi:nicotinamidase/pyrazinamidase
MKQIIFPIAAMIWAGTFVLASASVSVAVKDIGVIVVDVQADFTIWKQGSLAVPSSDDAYVKTVQQATEQLSKEGYLIFGTQDWHPADHISFYTNHPGKKAFEVIEIDGRTQVLWPPHCVQGTENARVLVDNNLFMAIVKKGQDPKYDSYSGFKDDGGKKTEMDQILARNGVKKILIYGIATDYCVKWTAEDAVDARYEVFVVEGLCRGVAPDTTSQAIEEMKNKGITILEDLDLQKIKEL